MEDTKLSGSMKTHVLCGISNSSWGRAWKFVHICRAVILPASERRHGMAPKNRMLEWKATGSTKDEQGRGHGGVAVTVNDQLECMGLCWDG